MLKENLSSLRHYAARLLVDHCAQDWRDVILDHSSHPGGRWQGELLQPQVAGMDRPADPRRGSRSSTHTKAAAISCGWRIRPSLIKLSASFMG